MKLPKFASGQDRAQPADGEGNILMSNDYAALTPETIAPRLGGLAVMRSHVGPPETWQVREVGDGNLNLVFIVSGAAGALVVKQALPYVRLVGESWPLPLERAFFEYHALTRQEARDPGSVPRVHYFDATQALIVMEYLGAHVILRQGLIAGNRYDGLGERLGRFCARTLFRGSDLHMPTAQRKADRFLRPMWPCATSPRTWSFPIPISTPR